MITLYTAHRRKSIGRVARPAYSNAHAAQLPPAGVTNGTKGSSITRRALRVD
jgi:hypothetical protein